MRSFLSALVALLATGSVGGTSPTPAPPSAAKPFSTFSNVTLFAPPADYNIPRTLYARTVLLSGSNVLLATWENYSPQPPLVYFPIFRSEDGGETWTHISNVTDQVNGFGLRYQPFLYELPLPMAGFDAGTILCAGNSIPEDLSSTHIDLYASTDKGFTWKFVSHIASGGEAIPDNGLTPIWEPFLLMFEGKMVVFYSDQRDPAHGQKLVHQVSSDLRTWGPVVDDVAHPTFTDRPGMTTVTQLPNLQWMMTYEYGGGFDPVATGYQFPANYRIASSPLLFNNSVDHFIQTADGTVPTSSPYLTWSPVGGPFGTIAVSTNSNTEIFINRNLGAVDAWVKVATPESASYSRHLRVMPNQKDLLILGAGVLSGTANTVTASVIDLSTI